MNSNYYGNFRNNNRNGYYPKKSYAKDNKKYVQQGNIREVEINSISQTEPSKPKFSPETKITYKMSEITNNVNETYSKLKKETIDSIMTIKTELEETIERTASQNVTDLNEIKALFSWQCLSDLRNHLVTLKGEHFAKPIIITSV